MYKVIAPREFSSDYINLAHSIHLEGQRVKGQGLKVHKHDNFFLSDF